MSTPSDQTPRSSEEVRRDMMSRFDAVNTAAEDAHQKRRDAGNATQSEEDKRWLRPEDNAGHSNDADDATNADEVGDNDAPGG